MVICKDCKESNFIVETCGIKHCFHSLANYYMNEDQKEEDKKGFWKAVNLKRYSYQTGFLAGILVGIQMMKYPPEIKFVKGKNGK